MLPSGWTPLGLIEHLGHAERHWFQDVVLGSEAPLPWREDPDDDDRGQTVQGFTTTRPAEVVFGFYREQIERANAVITTTPLTTPPRGRHGQGNEDQVVDLRFVVLHMIEETARHLGHLDAARELIDGRTGLGQDDSVRAAHRPPYPHSMNGHHRGGDQQDRERDVHDAARRGSCSSGASEAPARSQPLLISTTTTASTAVATAACPAPPTTRDPANTAAMATHAFGLATPSSSPPRPTTGSHIRVRRQPGARAR